MTQQAKCEECGAIFIVGVTGVTNSKGEDVCDGCNHTARNPRNNMIVFASMPDDEMDEEEPERLR